MCWLSLTCTELKDFNAFLCHYLTIVIMKKLWLCKNIPLLSIKSGIDLKIKFFYLPPGKAYSTPLTTDQKQFSLVRNPYMPRGREVWTGSDAQTTAGFIIWLAQRSLQHHSCISGKSLRSWGDPPRCCCAQSLHVCPADSLPTEIVVKNFHVEQCFLAKDWARVLINVFWSSRRQEVVQCCVTNKNIITLKWPQARVIPSHHGGWKRPAVEGTQDLGRNVWF